MKTTKTILGAAFLSALLSAGGCSYMPGGNMVSNDYFTYTSTAYQPKTLTLVDTRTGEVLWTNEIPVGQKVSVQFYENRSEGDPDFPDVMRWQVADAENGYVVLRNQIAVPDQWSRRMDMTLREVPESYPGGQASITP